MADEQNVSLVDSGSGEPSGGDGDVSVVNAGPAADTGAPAGAVGEPGDSKTAPAAGDAAKPGEAAGAKGPEPIIPEKYELKLPEGFTVDEAAMSELTPLLKDLKCQPEMAQKLLDLHFKQIKTLGDAQTKARDEAVGGWLKALKADTEIGGPDLMKNLSYGTKVLNKYATPELKNLLVDFGLDKNPDMAKMLVRIGKEISEDHWADGGRQGGAPKTADAVAKMFFDKTL